MLYRGTFEGGWERYRRSFCAQCGTQMWTESIESKVDGNKLPHPSKRDNPRWKD